MRIAAQRVENMSKERVLRQLDAEWSALNESYADLAQAELTKPGVVGEWSLKDILGHITTWEEEALKHLPLIKRGGTPPRYSALYGGIHAFNAQSIATKRTFPLSKIRKQMDETHRKLIDYIRKTPETQLIRETRFRRRLKQDTWEHYAKHAVAIRKWREK